MNRLFTDKEIQEIEKRIQELQCSLDPVDRVAAVLIDWHVGDHGLPENSAKAKAKKILDLFSHVKFGIATKAGDHEGETPAQKAKKLIAEFAADLNDAMREVNRLYK